MSRGALEKGGGSTYTAQWTYKIVRKWTLMDISEEPVIFPVDIQKTMTEDAGLLAILSRAECPRAFTAKDSVTHNSLLLLKTK